MQAQRESLPIFKLRGKATEEVQVDCVLCIVYPGVHHLI